MPYLDKAKEIVKDIEIDLIGTFYDEEDFMHYCEYFARLFDEISDFSEIINKSGLDIDEILNTAESYYGTQSNELYELLDFYEAIVGDYDIDIKHIFKYCITNNLITESDISN